MFAGRWCEGSVSIYCPIFTAMITISITTAGLTVNGRPLQLPASPDTLRKLFGDYRHGALKYAHVFTWDAHGIIGRSKKGRMIDNLQVSFLPGKFAFSPKRGFRGTITYAGTPIREVFATHLGGVRPRYVGPSAFDLCLGGTGLYFEHDKGVLEAVSVSVASEEEGEQVVPAPVDAEFTYLVSAWETWRTAAASVVPPTNKYYNLTSGVSREVIARHDELAPGITLPPELSNFYRVQDVKYNGVTAVFGFSVNDWQYDLIPFEDIGEEWRGIQELQFGDDLEPGATDQYSASVRATDYTNPRWIPLATGRNGDYLLYDTDPSSAGTFGQIIELQNEAWTRVVVADS